MYADAAPFNTKKVVYKVVAEFLQSIDDISDPKTILTDEDFDLVMETSDIKNRLADDFVSAEDGIAIGINVGFHIGTVKFLREFVESMKLSLDATDNSLENVMVEPDAMETNPVLLLAT